MTKIFSTLLVAATVAGSLSGCAYSGVAVSGDKAVVARNDAFLMGLLRKVYVCKVTDTGLSSCQESESP